MGGAPPDTSVDGAERRASVADDASPDQARDDLNLQTIRAARAAGDAMAEREALGKLLAPYREWGRSIAFAKLSGVGDRAGKAEVIAQDLMVRLVHALNRTTEFRQPFDVVARVNLDWAIKDHWRARKRDLSGAVDPADLEGIEDEGQSLAEQAHDFAPWLAGLPDRDRALLCERIFFGLSPETVAERHGLTPNAVNVALSRALARVRKNQPPPDVSDPAQGAEY